VHVGPAHHTNTAARGRLCAFLSASTIMPLVDTGGLKRLSTLSSGGSDAIINHGRPEKNL
jgi:hypothetical protein